MLKALETSKVRESLKGLIVNELYTSIDGQPRTKKQVIGSVTGILSEVSNYM
jgi:hypothetical protein